MRETPAFSAKIWNGRSTLRFMSAGCGMFHLRFRRWLGLRLRFGLGLRLGTGGGLRGALGLGLGVGFSFIYRLTGFGLFLRFVNCPDHIQRAFRIIFEFIAQDSLAAIERIFEADEFSLDAAELLGGEKRLGEESLQPPGAGDYVAVFRSQLFQAKHGDDVLEILVLRQRPPDFLGQEIMPVA